jgi:hypothetical protein
MRRRRTVIGHIKAEHRMGRNYLKGRDGDRINAVGTGREPLLSRGIFAGCATLLHGSAAERR